jgi:hypothetical protein
MKARTVNSPNAVARGMRKNTTAWSRNIARKIHLRPMKSLSQAHRNRPDPLAIEMMPTSPAAAIALTPERCAFWASVGSQPWGRQPSGGLRMSSDAPATMTR